MATVLGLAKRFLTTGRLGRGSPGENEREFTNEDVIVASLDDKGVESAKLELKSDISDPQKIEIASVEDEVSQPGNLTLEQGNVLCPREAYSLADIRVQMQPGEWDVTLESSAAPFSCM